MSAYSQDALLMWLLDLPATGPGIFSGQMLSLWNDVTLSRGQLMSTCDCFAGLEAFARALKPNMQVSQLCVECPLKVLCSRGLGVEVCRRSSSAGVGTNLHIVL